MIKVNGLFTGGGGDFMSALMGGAGMGNTGGMGTGFDSLMAGMGGMNSMGGTGKHFITLIIQKIPDYKIYILNNWKFD